jgi:FkbM family methyltransferase
MQKSSKDSIQIFLRRHGFYDRIKSSPLYDLYWLFADRRLIDNRNKEVQFYKRILKKFRKGDLIFDIGANYGYKTDIFLRLGARVVAVEPDASNQDALKKKFLRYRLVKKPVIIVGKAVSERDGAEIMWVDGPGSPLNTLNRKWVETLRTESNRFGKILEFEEQKKVETLTLEELIRSYGLPCYAKIDVEGHEVSVLTGVQSVIPVISFEVNLPEFKPEALQCIGLLERLAAGGEFNYAADCRRGLALDHWLARKTFTTVLSHCQESCIEVFWRAPEGVTAKSKGNRQEI